MIYFEGRQFVSEVSCQAYRRKQAAAEQKTAQAEADAQAKADAIAEGRCTIRSRNATTHGLFARDVVLTDLGEDPQGYESLFAELASQIEPGNLLERHYTEKIAAASWRLRRIHRWQAQIFEDDTLTEDERLDKLDKVLRHETALHRQIDSSVKLLSREVPKLFESRARETALSLVQATERDCAASEETDWEVARSAREHCTFDPLPDTFDYASLDNTHAAGTQNCQNEPDTRSPAPDPLPSEERPSAGEGSFVVAGRSETMSPLAGTPSVSIPEVEIAETNPPMPMPMLFSSLLRFGGGGETRAGGGSRG